MDIVNSDLMFEPGWYALYVGARRELVVGAKVKTLGCEIFLPTEQVLRTHARKREKVDRPLIQRYVFVRLERQGMRKGFRVPAFHELRAIPEVDALVGVLGRPCRIPSAHIRRLQAVEAELRAEAEKVKPWPPVEGDEVKVTKGACAGMTAKVVHARKDAKKIKILLDKMRCGLGGGELTIDVANLEAA